MYSRRCKYEKLYKKRKYSCVQLGTVGFVYISAMLADSHCCHSSYNYGDNVAEVLQTITGGSVMKFVVVDNPKFWSFFLRRIFKIKKNAQQDIAV